MSAAETGPRVAVVGAGAIGCLFGGTLRAGGLDVTLIDVWREHVEAIAAGGLRLTGHGGDRTVAIPATSDPDTVGPVDVVIVQTKSMNTRVAAESARSLFGPATVAISFQNGIGNEEIIGEVVGPERVLAGVTAQGAKVLEPGLVVNYGALPSWIGELAGGVSARAERIARAFTDAGLDTRAVADIRRQMWKKFLGNVGLSAASSITDLTSAEMWAIAELRETILAAVDEAVAVAAAEGIDLDPVETREVLHSLTRTTDGGTGASKSSACADLRAGRRTEADYISGAVVRLGERHGIPTPVNRTLVACVKGLEADLA